MIVSLFAIGIQGPGFRNKQNYRWHCSLDYEEVFKLREDSNHNLIDKKQPHEVFYKK